jgi:hypothetical protein
VKGRSAKRRPEANARQRPPAATARRAEAQPQKAPAHEASGDHRGKYVYCIIRSPEALRFGPIGIGAEPAHVHTVNHKDLE